MSPIATMRAASCATTGATGAQTSVIPTRRTIDRISHRNARRSILLNPLLRLVGGIWSCDGRPRRRLVVQIRIQRVIADVQGLTRLTLVAMMLLQHIARVSAAPGAHRVAALNCRHEM